LALLNKRRHWFDYVVFGVRAVWGVLGIMSLHYSFGLTGILLAGGIAGYVLSCCVPFALYLSKRVPRYAAPVAELLITGGLYLAVPVQDTFFSFFHVPVLTLGYLATGWHAIWAAAVVGLYPIVLVSNGTFYLPLDRFADELANLAVLFAFGFCFQRLVTSYQKINGMFGIIRKQNQTLENYAKQIEKLTLSEERNRLSRDLHDTVGHTFTTTITGMDAVYYLIDISPDEAKKSLRELLHVTRNGLDEVRRHIHQIAPDKDEQSLVQGLSQIGGQFALHTGTNVTFETEGAEYPVSDFVRTAFIRCLQESLTNAKKHGMATVIRVKLTFERERVAMRIEDNGKGDESLTQGFGLQTMTERLSNVNGSLTVTSSADKGTVVHCTVPVFANAEKKLG